jgi:hypothetical protein
MPVQHIGFDKTSQHGNRLFSHLNRLEIGLEGLNDELATMSLMIDGDGTSDTHFTYMTSKYGFTDNATAKAAFEEMSSFLAKLNTDNSVTNVSSALLQAFNKFR